VNTILGNQIANAGSDGTAPALLKALVVLVHPCGQVLPDIASKVYPAMFDESNPNTWAAAHKACSKGKSTVVGKVVGPVTICPEGNSNDLIKVWREVEKELLANYKDDSDAYKYKILIQPDAWQDSIGSGLVGGPVSWVRAKYYDKASMHLHEVGHNMYLHHAGNFDGTSEYGDGSSAMGACCSKRCYHFIHAWQLGWSEVAHTLQNANIPTNDVLDVDIKSMVSHDDNGVTLPHESGGSNKYVFSYRGSTGFDADLHSDYKDQIYVHKYPEMTKKDSAHVSHLLDTLAPGETKLIGGSGYKLTWHATVAGVAKVRFCMARFNTEPCGQGSGVTVAPTPSGPNPSPAPSPVPTHTSWTSYFSDEEVGGEISSQAMIGLGCKGKYCDNVRTGHSPTIRVNLDQAQWQVSTNDVDDLTCEGNSAISRLKCQGSYCARIMVECAPVMGGQLVRTAMGAGEKEVPVALHAEETYTCPAGTVITSIRCGGTSCAKKRVSCTKFQKTSCKSSETCSALGLTCSVDGCGTSCGTCRSSDFSNIAGATLTSTCLGGSGRCVAMGVFSDWFSRSKDMATTGLATTGVGCQGRYCDEVRLHLLGVKVDTTQLAYSDWISDNTGAKWPWNSETFDQVAECPMGQVITRIECRGRYCDDLKLECATPLSWKVDSIGRPWHGADWFSEEGAGSQDCPTGFAMVGLECQKSKSWCLSKCGDYCDNKKIRCRQITPSNVGTANMGIAGNQEIARAMVPAKSCDETCRGTDMFKMSIAGSAIAPSAFFALTLSTFVCLA